MVDVDRHMGGLTPAHAAGLRRLSARASAAPTSSTAAVSHHGGLLSFRPLVESVLARLRAASVPIRPGLSDAEVSRLEADLAVSFPPDLRAILVLGLPSAPGFPDWRPSSSSSSYLPLAAAALQVARGALWPRSWGPRPSDPDRALGVARAALRRSPFLIPVFDRCYIPSRPCLAGNPIFYVDEHRVFCCGFDLADFFQREPAFPPASRRGPHPISSSDPPLPPPPPPPARRSLDAVAGRTPRWIEFWSDAASDRRRRNSSSSSSSSSSGSASPRRSDSQRSVEIRSQRRLPSWVDRYLDQIGSVLRSSGWGESDVIEIIGVPPSRFFDGDVEPSTAAAIDSDAALDALLVNADRCSQSLLRAGWSPDEVSDALGFDFLRRGGRRERPPMELPPEIAAKVEKLAEAVPTS
ncbi:hypothetical protein MUK42_07112 [Musa troglodytarum]|uniref:Knr4/Smi1-like domain-containing protein n=1 Tax=Musa troglodytarum TaxID=320322 RepID=A0A9E7L1S6_9LILI|nr:hypothetical protein MUK42_07112 [Musa troglodytarum]